MRPLRAEVDRTHERVVIVAWEPLNRCLCVLPTGRLMSVSISDLRVIGPAKGMMGATEWGR